MTTIKTRLCFVRHGETAWNAEQRMQGHKDLPLNEDGLAQAEQAAHYFISQQVAALYSSDLQRAQQTARPIGEVLNLSVALLPELRERNYGRCEGMIRSEIVAVYPEDARALRERLPDYVVPGGESIRQHQQRVLECVGRLARAHAGQAIVIVTHGGVLDLVYRHATGMALEKRRDFPIPNTGINWLTICGEDWQIDSWAETAHLGERGAIEVTANF
ncbi:MAG: histidine phosphatase family protein [Betaproteobacteria bacterium]